MKEVLILSLLMVVLMGCRNRLELPRHPVRSWYAEEDLTVISSGDVLALGNPGGLHVTEYQEDADGCIYLNDASLHLGGLKVYEAEKKLESFLAEKTPFKGARINLKILRIPQVDEMPGAREQ